MNERLFLAGETPGKSLYECTNCKDFLLFIQHDHDFLPKCPKCSGEKFANVLIEEYMAKIEP